MKKGSYGRSFLWILAFFGLPVVLFAVMMLEVSRWQKPTWGPEAVSEGELAPKYQSTAAILAVVAALPYLFLLLRFSERIHLTDKGIRRIGLFGNRNLLWEDVIEYRDFRNYIQLVPMQQSSQLCIDYYVTFNRHTRLSRAITRKCREVDANMMVRRRRSRLTVCDLGVVPAIFFAAASGVLLYFRQRIVFLGILSGVVLSLLSAWVWVTSRRSIRRWKSGGYIYGTLFILSLILPPAYFGQEMREQGFVALGMFGLFYLVGLMAGCGVMTALLPSRRRR